MQLEGQDRIKLIVLFVVGVWLIIAMLSVCADHTAYESSYGHAYLLGGKSVCIAEPAGSLLAIIAYSSPAVLLGGLALWFIKTKTHR
jgi:hypothetical protein